VEKRKGVAAAGNEQGQEMTPERNKQVDEIVQTALDRSEKDRAAFLDELWPPRLFRFNSNWVIMRMVEPQSKSKGHVKSDSGATDRRSKVADA
jgi:hypothetical protein